MVPCPLCKFLSDEGVEYEHATKLEWYLFQRLMEERERVRQLRKREDE